MSQVLSTGVKKSLSINPSLVKRRNPELPREILLQIIHSSIQSHFDELVVNAQAWFDYIDTVGSLVNVNSSFRKETISIVHKHCKALQCMITPREFDMAQDRGADKSLQGLLIKLRKDTWLKEHNVDMPTYKNFFNEYERFENSFWAYMIGKPRDDILLALDSRKPAVCGGEFSK